MGPTAAGKTALALKLAQQLPCGIISVDSAMVYRDMDIGTAKPLPAVLAEFPHYLLNIRDPAESYSAAEFRKDATEKMAEISSEGKIPLLTGGTGLYFRALQYGLAELPGADPVVREALLAEAGRNGWEALHAQLREVDPRAAARIHPHDPHRIQRALEVYRVTGRPISEIFRHQSAKTLPYRVIKLVLAPTDRNALQTRIARRFNQMLADGIVSETELLFQRGDLNLDMPSMRAVGYRQVWHYLAGNVTYNEMIGQAVTATRQLAKRQFTWLRRERESIWLDSEASEVAQTVLKQVGNIPIDSKMSE